MQNLEIILMLLLAIAAFLRKNPEFKRYAAIALSLVVVKTFAKLIAKRVPKRTILEIDLDEKIREVSTIAGSSV